MKKENKIVRNFIIGIFVTLYLFVSTISTIHVVDFFQLSNPFWLAITLAIAFEIGAAASLASVIALEKMNKGIVWILFFVLTAMQSMGNSFYAYVHLTNYQGWVELFGLVDYEIIAQKRILAIISGAILPLVALGFIKALVDYIKPSNNDEKGTDDILDETPEEIDEIMKKYQTDYKRFDIPISGAFPDAIIHEIPEELEKDDIIPEIATKPTQGLPHFKQEINPSEKRELKPAVLSVDGNDYLVDIQHPKLSPEEEPNYKFSTRTYSSEDGSYLEPYKEPWEDINAELGDPVENKEVSLEELPDVKIENVEESPIPYHPISDVIQHRWDELEIDDEKKKTS